MERYEHITKMENIMVQHEQMVQELDRLLRELQAHQPEYRELIEYYCGPQRTQDLEDDAQHRIPEELCRGVLSEDEIFDLIGDYRDAAIQMLETAVQMLKI